MVKKLLAAVVLAGTAVAQPIKYEEAGVEVKWVGPNVMLAQSPQSLPLTLPGFARGLAIYRLKKFWTCPVFTSDYRTLAGDSQLLLWKRQGDSEFHLLAPLTGSDSVASLGVRDHRFGVQGTRFVYAHGLDPYALMTQAYRAAGMPLRTQKAFPQPFNYLGWCSWNAFYDKVDAAAILESARWMRLRKVPAAWILVDDGWMQQSQRRLTGMDADRQKFPGGLAALSRRLKTDFGFRYVGVWHTLQGYWDGVSAGQPARDGLFLPEPGFFQRWHSQLQGWGIDFVKVDNQAGQSRFRPGLEAARLAQEELQASPLGDQVINCMEMTLENVYYYTRSNVARSSDDYLPGELQNSSEHVFQNAFNSVWLANFAWPDFDMFESGLADGEFQAVARAISGGPVYFTDAPGKGNPAILKRLCLADGRLLRPDQPARVPVARLLDDPTTHPIPLVLENTITRPGYKAHLLACFHVNKEAHQVQAELAGTCYGYRSHRLTRTAPLKPLQCEVLTEIPTGVDCYPLGLVDKYLGAAAIHSVGSKGGHVRVKLAEPGRFGAYCRRRPEAVIVDGRGVPFQYKDSLLQVRLSRPEVEILMP